MASSELTPAQLENRRKAFDLADSWAKFLSGLATGTIILSATFIKDVFPNDRPLDHKGFLFVAWLALGLSTIMGILVLSGLTANLVSSRSTENLDVYHPTIRVPALFQIVTLVLGLALFAFFVGKNL